MKTQNYHFNIGSFKCIAVSDGTMTYAPPMFPPPPVFLFCNAGEKQLPRVLNEHGIKCDEWREWVSSYTCLLVDTGEYTVLIDTGAGNLGQDTGKLMENLEEEGIRPEDIQIVILSHGHPDHVGGNINASGKPVFSEARWIMGKDEWTFWTSEQAEQQLNEHGREILIKMARTNLLPLKDKIDLVEDEVEIVPGIRAIDASGHTPGLIALSITSGGDSLLCISDAVIHPVHLAEPEWYAATDVIPDRVIATRYRLLNKAISERSLISASHFPFPGLGYVAKEKKGWKWQPL